MRPPLHPHQLRKGHRIREYRVLRVLAEGGFSRVFLVRLKGRRYVLKLATTSVSEKDPDHVDGWMRREAASLELLVHPHLLPVYETGRWPDPSTGYSFFVTDPVEGSTFHAWRRQTRASPFQWVDALCEVLRVLEHLHERGVVHRDLKADNVLVRAKDSQPFVIDLGSVHLPWARPLTEGTAPATLHCQPPEAVAFLYGPDMLDPQAKLEAHPTADLYCVGFMLYEALTEQPPFRPKQPLAELLPAILHTPPADPLQLNPQAPASLAALCLRLLAKEPQSRPQSARFVREELERLRAEEGHTASWQEPSPPPEDSGHVRRARHWASAGAVLALGLGVLALGWALLRTQGASPVQVPHVSISQRPSVSSPSPSSLCRLLHSVLGGMAAGWLAGCATTPTPVPPDPLALLARCSTEARITPRTLGFQPGSDGPDFYWYPTYLTTVTPASSLPIEDGGPLNIRSGPIRALMYARVGGKDVEFPVEGEALVTPCRVWVEIHRIQAPSGGWLPLCGVASMGIEREWGLATYACDPGVTPPEPAKVDTRPGSALINHPRMEVFVQPADARVKPSFLRMPPADRR